MVFRQTLNQQLKSLIGSSFGADVVEENVEKAIRSARVRASNPKSLFLDPMSVFMGREWLLKRGTPLGFKDLRAMARNPIIDAIISTRLNQISLFAKPQQNIFEPGFVIVSDDEEANKDEKRKKEISDFVWKAGLPGHGELSFETWIRKFMRDSLVLDQACAEIVPRFNGKPAYVQPIDGGTIRLLKNKPQEFIPSKQDRYAQIINEVIHTTFNEDELIFGVRNPNTDIDSHGYGTSELEVLLITVTALMNTERFNGSLVASGGTNKGIFVIAGEASKQQVDSFKIDLREALRNASHYWNTPVIQVHEGSKVEFLNVDKSNRDIEYAQLFDFLVKQATAVYNIHPDELGWSVKASGTRTSFDSGKANQINHSLEKGLKPLLKFLADIYTNCIIIKIDPRFRMEFRGVNVDKERDIKNIVSEVTNYKTLNEARIEQNKPPLPFGDFPLNQNYIFFAIRSGQGDNNDSDIGNNDFPDKIDVGTVDDTLKLDKPRNVNGEERTVDKQRETENINLARNQNDETVVTR